MTENVSVLPNLAEGFSRVGDGHSAVPARLRFRICRRGSVPATCDRRNLIHTKCFLGISFFLEILGGLDDVAHIHFFLMREFFL